MKIAVVYQHYYPEPFRLTDLCEELVKRGHSVTVYTGLPNYPHGNVPKKYKFFRNRHEIRNGVKIERVFEIGRKKGKLGLALNYVSYTLSAIRKALFIPLDFDVIFAYSTSPILMSLPGVVLRKRSGKAMLMYIMDIWPACLSAMNVAETSFLYKKMTDVSRYTYKQCDMLTYSSRAFINYMQNIHKINMKSENYMPQFADALFENVSNNNSYDKGDEPWRFVFAGNIGNMQGVDIIIRAADRLKDKKIEWYIIGDGTAFAVNKNLVKELNLEKIVHMPGRKPLKEMPKYYDLADAMLVTMNDDELVSFTLPGKVQSYMACGKPILGSINGETAQIIDEAGCGICAEAENLEDFIETILTFISKDNSERKKMAENALDYYNNNFTMTKHIDRLEQQLQSLVK